MLKMWRTLLRNLWRGPVTRRYPAVRREPFPGVRGKLEIEKEQCVFCGLCARRCPADALAVSRAQKTWSLDPCRCIGCGFCVEACPKQCLAMNPAYPPPLARKERVIVSAATAAEAEEGKTPLPETAAAAAGVGMGKETKADAELGSRSA